MRVASVPEFLAKQLLKEFGFPWHVAPGEAEAECALLQQAGLVDAVMSEDVDTLMFGSGVTIRNWTAEGKGKVPTHVNVYRAEETKEKSGLDREGMILVAMMSGGDYIVEGIPGCGPRVACDAARAGFGKDLCEIARRKDVAGLQQWKERLQREINTNESKFFTRKNKLIIPEDFPSREVLGYYTYPCVSTPDKVERLRESLRWDQGIDFIALRNFTADAFDWRCISGAKKFVRNLAPAMLVRELRLRESALPQHEDASTYQQHVALEAQEEEEKALVSTIHSKRKHATTDNELEYRISFTPMNLVPIDLSIEDEDDGLLAAGGAEEILSEADNEWATVPSSTPAPGENGEEDDDATTTKTRGPSLYDPTQPEKLWLMADFLKRGCPLMVQMYENGTTDPKAILKARREARSKAKGDSNIHAGGKKPSRKGKKKVANDMPANSLMAYTTVTKSSQGQGEKDTKVLDVVERPVLRDLSPRTSGIRSNSPNKKTVKSTVVETAKNDGPVFQRMSSQWLTKERPSRSATNSSFDQQDEDDDLTPKASRRTAPPKAKAASKKIKPSTKSTQTTIINPERPFAQFAKKDISRESSSPFSTPKKKQLKRPSTEDLEMSSARSQRTINSYFSPTPKKNLGCEIIDLLSSSPVKDAAVVPPPPPPAMLTAERVQVLEGGFVRDLNLDLELELDLPASVTKRRVRRPMKRAKTAPVGFGDDDGDFDRGGRKTPELALDYVRKETAIEMLDLASPSPVRRKNVDVMRPPAMSRHSGVVDMPTTSRAAKETHLSPPPPPPTRLDTAAEPLRRSPRTSLPRTTSFAATSSSSTASAITKSKTKPKDRATAKAGKKQRIHLRASLEGAWKFVDADMLDLTEDIAGGVRVHGEDKVRGWRKSGVEILDLTED